MFYINEEVKTKIMPLVSKDKKCGNIARLFISD